MINFISENIDFQLDNKEKISLWLQKTAAECGKKIGTLNYIFCSDKIIVNINNKYLNHNYLTDIITFDYSTKNVISGDIYIGIETVRSNAKEYNTQFDNELHRVIIHGLLHLTGQNDKTELDKQEMTRKENSAINNYESM